MIVNTHDFIELRSQSNTTYNIYLVNNTKNTLLTKYLTQCLTDWLTACLPACLPACLSDWLIDWLTDWLTDCLTVWLFAWLCPCTEETRLQRKLQPCEDMIDHCSCAHNLSSCEIWDWKNFRPKRDSNPYMHSSIIWTFIYSSTDILQTRSGKLPVGLIAQLVEHCTGIAEVMGTNPV